MDGKLEPLQWGKIQQREPHMIIQADASRLAGILQGSSTGEKWSTEEKHFHINVLELLALMQS